MQAWKEFTEKILGLNKFKNYILYSRSEFKVESSDDAKENESLLGKISNYIGKLIFKEELPSYTESTEEDINLLIFRTTSDVIRNAEIKKEIPENLVKFYEKIKGNCESYFTKQKYTKDNKMLEVVENILIHMTKNVICNGIEVYTKKAILKYLLQKYPNRDFKYYDSRINAIFNNTNSSESISDYLYNKVSKRLVKNAILIHENRQTEISYINESVEEILSDYILLIQSNPITPLNENEYVIKILNKDIISYFSLITNNIINNWLVVCENQMKFVINQYRSIKCYNSMIN